MINVVKHVYNVSQSAICQMKNFVLWRAEHAIYFPDKHHYLLIVTVNVPLQVMGTSGPEV